MAITSFEARRKRVRRAKRLRKVFLGTWTIEGNVLSPTKSALELLCKYLFACAGDDDKMCFIFRDGRTLVHRSALRAAPGPLNVLCSGDFKESLTCQIQMTDTDVETFEPLRWFLYCQNIEVSSLTATVVLLADRWCLSILVDAFFISAELREELSAVKLVKDYLPLMAFVDPPERFKSFFAHRFAVSFSELKGWLGIHHWSYESHNVWEVLQNRGMFDKVSDYIARYAESDECVPRDMDGKKMCRSFVFPQVGYHLRQGSRNPFIIEAESSLDQGARCKAHMEFFSNGRGKGGWDVALDELRLRLSLHITVEGENDSEKYEKCRVTVSVNAIQGACACVPADKVRGISLRPCDVIGEDDLTLTSFVGESGVLFKAHGDMDKRVGEREDKENGSDDEDHSDSNDEGDQSNFYDVGDLWWTHGDDCGLVLKLCVRLH